MRVELHLLQSFAPSNLNRDDTNAPKDAEFGGFRRARISSQCLKRAVREHFRQNETLERDLQAIRTKRVVHVLEEALQEAGIDADKASAFARVAIEASGLGLVSDEEGAVIKTEYLLFLPRRTVQQVATLVSENQKAFADAAEKLGKKKKRTKKDAKKVLPADVAKGLEAALFSSHKCPEIALFGRMLADTPESNVDAACQVAHAISTHRLAQEFDFYTAVDDLKPDDASGADMMGTIQFNASTFYRYSQLDLAELSRNLDVAEGDEQELIRKTLKAWIQASVLAIPTGKQNSMAAHNPPSFVLACVTERAPCSLANAFLSPARPGNSEQDDLMSVSVSKLTSHLDSIASMYGTEGMQRLVWMAGDEVRADSTRRLNGDGPYADVSERAQPLETLIERVLEAVS